ncbi:MAG TPA: methionine--tRNA ligase [Terriglobales bacterium]|nr:methionine--tRNA ligase [Terriglobales bacterium]
MVGIHSVLRAADSAMKFYITTPIYYVNSRAHVGHAYTTIACDAVARRQRMLGVDTYFLTGTDEHGQKIERSAAAAGKSPKAFADEVSGDFRRLWDKMGISYDRYIRTTDEDHKRGVAEMFKRIRDNGFIYKATYTGQYCVSDELYVDAPPGAPCPDCGNPTETVSEDNYFFKLSAFEDKLLKLYAQPDFIRPDSRRNEVASFVRSGLRDLSISRASFKWGIPVPEDPDHVIYVWLDALSNYCTAIGFGSNDKADQERFAKYWPADVHMIGKEIVRFHCVYWPAFLMAAGLPVPKSIVTHGWLLFEESKMSKSRGNIVRPESVIDVLGNDALRYFLLREVAFGQDGAFSFDALVQRFDSDLANGLGNLSSRTLTMIQKYFQGQVPYPSPTASHAPAEDSIAKLAAEVVKNANQLFAEYQFARGLDSVWSLVAAVNKYIVESEPWVVAEKNDEESRARLATILYTSAEALRIATALVHPVLPESTLKIWSQLGLTALNKVNPQSLKWGGLPFGTRLGKVEAVFPRTDKSTIERMQSLENDKNQAGAPSSAQPETPAPAGVGAQAGQPATQAAAGVPAAPAAPIASASDGKITIDDFTKIELRVGLVKTAEKVKGADRLLKLEVDIGTEVRQIVAGIALAYDPEKLIGRKVVIVANLAPRKLRGLESNGMIVAASVGEQGLPVLASFLEDVPVGARLK